MKTRNQKWLFLAHMRVGLATHSFSGPQNTLGYNWNIALTMLGGEQVRLVAFLSAMLLLLLTPFDLISNYYTWDHNYILC